MSVVVDLDRSPREAARRRRDLVLGLLVAAAVGALAFGRGLPWLVGLVLGGATDFDAKLRAQDRLMAAVCAEPVPGRDEALCGCALAVPYPSLDCQDSFAPWLAARVAELCAQGAVQATAYCTCMTTVAEELVGEDPAEARKAVPRCMGLADAVELDRLSELLAPPGATGPP